MHGEGNLVASLVERLVTKLPHRTGLSAELLEKDELVSQARATLIDISTTRLSTVAESLLLVLEELITQYRDNDVTPPPHVRCSEIYLIGLVAQCCCAHWDYINKGSLEVPKRDENRNLLNGSHCSFDPYKQATSKASRGTELGQQSSRNRKITPKSLDDLLVGRILEALRIFLAPFSDQYALPGASILGESAYLSPQISPNTPEDRLSSAVSSTDPSFKYAEEDVEAHCRIIVEFLSASNWVMIFEYFRRSLRIQPSSVAQQATGGLHSQMLEQDHDALVALRLVAFFWIDARALRLVLQEVATCFYSLRKPLQNTLALVLPTLIVRWIEHNPEEFINLHTTHTKLDSGVDRLFDIANSMIDNGRWRSVLYPFQMSLLLLIPDVFDVATSMPTVGKYMDSAGLPKAGTPTFKKVAFLESLRKALRNRNSAAAYSLVLLLRVAPHFDIDTSDSALLSYALDVQDDIREALFRKVAATKEPPIFDDGLMTAAFVTLAKLNFKTFETLVVPLCFSAGATNDYRAALLSACGYLAQLPNHRPFVPVFAKVAQLVRAHLKDFWLKGRSHASTQQISATPGSSSELLTIRSLKFLEALPLVLFDGSPKKCRDYEEFLQECFCILVHSLISGSDDTKDAAIGVSKSVLADGSIFCVPEHVDLGADDAAKSLWRWTSAVLVNVIESAESTGPPSRAVLGFIHSFLKSRLEVIRGLQETSLPSAEIYEHLETLFKLESFFLRGLCSADIETCKMVTSCIRLLCEEAVVVDDAEDTPQPSLVPKNLEVYQALSSKEFRFTGLVAFQKRFRSILREIKDPSIGILNAWEDIFERWCQLSTRAFSSRKLESLDEPFFVEWRNCTGFLASSAACCVSTQVSGSGESGMSGWKFIDMPSPIEHEQTPLDEFMTRCMQLLGCGHARMREAVREAVSSEMSPSLYYPLSGILETELHNLFNASLDTSPGFAESAIAFAEHAAALLKTIVDRLDSPTEVGANLSVDVGALTQNFAQWLGSLKDGSTVLRVKIKVCQLCEAVTSKKELLNLRHDVRTRNKLVEIIFSWITRPTSPASSLPQSAPRDDVNKLQKELEKASLSALSALTFRLPLQPTTAQTDAETSDLKSELFQSYFVRFLSYLSHGTPASSQGGETSAIVSGREDSNSARELATLALSNMLSANIDVGLKHCLGFGYHDEFAIRTAFLTVLCNVLAQGTEFTSLSDIATKDKYDELVDVLVKDMALTVALCDACPSTEVDELTMSLLNIFDSRGLGFVLLQELIENEVKKTTNEAELLRGNSVTTKMLFVYGKWKGAAYLKSTLQDVLERLAATSDDLDLELDPNKTSSPEELQRNAVQLRLVTKVFVDDICNSATIIPVSFRKICSIISTSVTTKFPESRYNAVGSFIFLRFFCPAICSPDEHGLTSVAPPIKLRRALVLIAKIIQNLANNVLFGAKEGYMDTLNDFMARQGPRITAFLREISITPKMDETRIEKEVFDFGSCVALHRFFYDHWDHVRQKLVLQQRKVPPHSSQEADQGRVPVVEVLRNLISNLGPPPMNISWNRPDVSKNSPPLYSRFQHFMLKNAGKSTESDITTKAVYDAGESKNGMPIICIVLRNIDAEAATEFDLLLFCFLKIASRMWKKPFGVLVDSTCYTGQNEPQDALFKKLELLTPAEMRKNLTHIFVYNMNSAFRKCFRRIMRLSMKDDGNVLHPGNVEYHMIGDIEDLQSHFHVNQLHLPGETQSIMADARFVFQPIIRLSKTKGKIEVAIQVGSQYMQIKTTRRQEVVTGLRLSATVNDIFRIAEVDEVPTSVQTEDDSAFGLRTESGKIVMYFTSPRKLEILQAIRGAKSKQFKDTKPLPLLERSVRAQDVPGTLLNISFMNMASSEPNLRIAGYNLLCALCKSFRFATTTSFLSSKELVMPANAGHFIVAASRELAYLQPQLTGDFINEFFVGWDNFPSTQRYLSLEYLAPWLPALRTQVLATDTDGEKARDKVASMLRRLVEVAVGDATLAMTLERKVWPVICQDEVLTEILIDELVKSAIVPGPLQSKRICPMSTIASSFETIVVRGKIIARLRKAINRTSLRPTKTLPDNPIWNEICVLLNLCLALSFSSEVQGRLYFAEIAHIITMLANTGPIDMRQSVHGLLINTIHSFCTNSSLEEAKLVRLRVILASLSIASNEHQVLLNGLSRDGVLVSQTAQHSMQIMTTTEALANLLLEVSYLGAPSVDLGNFWRSRWMGLVASTAFQSNPAIQPRAFTVMGCIAREEVDDDLLYQVLVALRNSVNRFAVDNDNDMLASIVTSLTKMMKNLPTTSRYGLQLFWLAMALVRLVPLNLFACAAFLLQAVLLNINTSGDLKDGRMVQVLLQGRTSLENPALLLDESYGIQFNVDNFHFAVCASLVKGLTDSTTKATTLRVLSTFLEITSTNTQDGRTFPDDLSCLPYLVLLVNRVTPADEAKGDVWLVAGLTTGATMTATEQLVKSIPLELLKDKELLLNAAIGAVDFVYLEEAIQNRGLQWLNRIAIDRPTVVLHLFEPIFGVLDDILHSSQNSQTLQSAQNLLRTLTTNPKLADTVDAAGLLEAVLDDLGFSGLWRSSTFHTTLERDNRCSVLTEQLIELIIS